MAGGGRFLRKNTYPKCALYEMHEYYYQITNENPLYRCVSK